MAYLSSRDNWKSICTNKLNFYTENDGPNLTNMARKVFSLRVLIPWNILMCICIMLDNHVTDIKKWLKRSSQRSSRTESLLEKVITHFQDVSFALSFLRHQVLNLLLSEDWMFLSHSLEFFLLWNIPLCHILFKVHLTSSLFVSLE